MGKFKVTAEKEAQLLSRMEKLGIQEDELEEKFILGGGPGGQKINKTASCVYLKHKPSGIEVKCQQSRSQALNRFLARRELCGQMDARINRKKSVEQQKREKIRRQKRKRSKRAKDKMLDEKAKVGEKK